MKETPFSKSDGTCCKWVIVGNRLEYRTKEGEPVMTVVGNSPKDAIRKAKFYLDQIIIDKETYALPLS
jgi:hypothetical protein